MIGSPENPPKVLPPNTEVTQPEIFQLTGEELASWVQLKPEGLEATVKVLRKHTLTSKGRGALEKNPLFAKLSPPLQIFYKELFNTYNSANNELKPRVVPGNTDILGLFKHIILGIKPDPIKELLYARPNPEHGPLPEFAPADPSKSLEITPEQLRASAFLTAYLMVITERSAENIGNYTDLLGRQQIEPKDLPLETGLVAEVRQALREKPMTLEIIDTALAAFRAIPGKEK